jgi:lipopolysaccharide assembly protein A
MVRLVISLPFLLFLVLFALSNREPVAIGLWPTGIAWDVPLSIALLIVAAVAFLFGALIVWITELAQRRRARRAEWRMRMLEEQVEELKGRLGVREAVAPPAE